MADEMIMLFKTMVRLILRKIHVSKFMSAPKFALTRFDCTPKQLSYGYIVVFIYTSVMVLVV